jgi:hypothetical protein
MIINGDSVWHWCWPAYITVQFLFFGYMYHQHLKAQ